MWLKGGVEPSAAKLRAAGGVFNTTANDTQRVRWHSGPSIWTES
jgi:hypothetical protein